MKTKDEVLHYFKLFHDMFIPYIRSLNKDLTAITIHSDLGEFHSQAVTDYCNSVGLRLMTTCAYSPQQNGLIERTWRSISEAAVAMLLTANLPEHYWEEARRTAGYIRNRITGGHPSIDNVSPFEKMFGTKPHLRHFKVFGVWAFPQIPVKPKDHQPKSQQGVFVGYDDNAMGGYRVYLPETNEFIVSTHVTFGKSPNRSQNTIESQVTVEEQKTYFDLQRAMVDNLTRVLQQQLERACPTGTSAPGTTATDTSRPNEDHRRETQPNTT